MRLRILLILLALSLLLAGVQFFAMYAYGLQEVEWYFTPSHIIGGICAALGVIAVFIAAGYRPTLVVCLVMVGCIGVLWEILEYMAGVQMGLMESGSDLVADISGALIGWAIYRNI
jgi:hypothetical protein